MFTFIPMGNGFRRAAPLALIVAFGLAACGGGYSGSGMGYGMSAGAGSKLFAADAGYPGIGSLINPDPPTGMVVVDRFFYAGGLTMSVGSLSLDTVNDRLYVGNGTSILVYNSASMATGIPSPDRTITGITSAASLFIDAANNHNRLYVGDAALGVKVFDPADMANGMTTPSGFLTGNFGTTFQIGGVAVDATKDILYVSNTTLTPTASSQISLFTASTADGTKTPNVTITPMSGMNNLSVAGIALDSTHDRLYVAGPAPTVMVFDAVSTLPGGATSPNRTITLPGQIRSVAIDPVGDRLYAVALSGVAIYIVEAASTATGTPSVVKAIGAPYGNFTAVAVNPM